MTPCQEIALDESDDDSVSCREIALDDSVSEIALDDSLSGDCTR